MVSFGINRNSCAEDDWWPGSGPKAREKEDEKCEPPKTTTNRMDEAIERRRKKKTTRAYLYTRASRIADGTAQAEWEKQKKKAPKLGRIVGMLLLLLLYRFYVYHDFLVFLFYVNGAALSNANGEMQLFLEYKIKSSGWTMATQKMTCWPRHCRWRKTKTKNHVEAFDAMRISRGKRIECKLCAQCLTVALRGNCMQLICWTSSLCVSAMHSHSTRPYSSNRLLGTVVILLYQRTLSGDYVRNARMQWQVATNLNKWANDLRKSRIKLYLSTMNSCFLIRERITFFGVCRNDVRKQFRLQFLT